MPISCEHMISRALWVTAALGIYFSPDEFWWPHQLRRTGRTTYGRYLAVTTQRQYHFWSYGNARAIYFRRAAEGGVKGQSNYVNRMALEPNE